MAFIQVGEENSTPIELYYEDQGSGQPVVMIHGFPLYSGAWEKEKYPLLLAGYRTITYDRRGFGNSSKPSVGYDYDTFAADLEKIMTGLDLTDVILIGHSMGTGEVARYLGTYGSKRVSKAVFISPIPPFLLKTDDHPEGADQSLFDDIQQSILQDRLAYLTSFCSDFYNVDENLGKRVSQQVVQFSWNIASTASPKGTHDCVSAWLTDFRPDVAKIDVPSLIIQGDADRILPFPITGKKLHESLKNSELVVLEGAPHGIPWTHAVEINSALMDFLKKPASA